MEISFNIPVHRVCVHVYVCICLCVIFYVCICLCVCMFMCAYVDVCACLCVICLSYLVYAMIIAV